MIISVFDRVEMILEKEKNANTVIRLSTFPHNGFKSPLLQGFQAKDHVINCK